MNNLMEMKIIIKSMTIIGLPRNEQESIALNFQWEQLFNLWNVFLDIAITKDDYFKKIYNRIKIMDIHFQELQKKEKNKDWLIALCAMNCNLDFFRNEWNRYEQIGKK